MIKDTILDLSNEDYHNAAPYNEYLSSTQLKYYAKSPKVAKYMLDNPQQEKSDAMQVGSLFHLAMELYKKHGSIDAFYDSVAIFMPPKNPKTAQPYGTTTKAYQDALCSFKELNPSKSVVTYELATMIDDMVGVLVNNASDTSKQVNKLLQWGTSEVSHFVEYKDCKFKYRPDLETKQKIIDWKTVNTDDLSEKSINSIISKYGYDISAAFYLFMEHLRTGIWKTFYWCFVSKAMPYDAVLVDASRWTYEHDGADVVMPQVGAIKMKSLLDLHVKCSNERQWPGAEIYIPQDQHGRRIMTPTPPQWEISQASAIIDLLDIEQ
jgi:hypothetical protein